MNEKARTPGGVMQDIRNISMNTRNSGTLLDHVYIINMHYSKADVIDATSVTIISYIAHLRFV